MPIKIPDDLPARATLNAEGVMVMRETDAVRQDIRPLRIGLLNLMPNKVRTETQLAQVAWLNTASGGAGAGQDDQPCRAQYAQRAHHIVLP